jgi:tRNA-splicing ligase RtcB
MLTARFDAEARLLDDDVAAPRLLAALRRYVPTNRQRSGEFPQHLPDELAARPLSSRRLESVKQRDGLVQLGTLGRGNHFLEFQADEGGRLWVLIHSGSRAVGKLVTSHHTAIAAALGQSGLLRLDTQDQTGQDYLADAAWAGDYADRNRLAILAAVERILVEMFQVQLDRSSLIHTQHNYVRMEVHEGSAYWVHRKGAQSAQANELGVIPGSMNAPTFHVTGRGCGEALMSCSHGAGRRLRRGEARQTISVRQFLQQVRGVRFDSTRSHALLDEAPLVYKDIGQVMRAQRELVRIERELQPVLGYKG